MSNQLGSIMRKNINSFLLVLLIFLINGSFAKKQSPEKVQVLHTIEFDYKHYPEERLFAYEFFCKIEEQYTSWMTLEHIGIAFYDINNDGQKELFAFVNGNGMCPNVGCPFALFRKINGKYVPLKWAREQIDISTHNSPRILSTIHKGYHDISFGNRAPDPEIAIWMWYGHRYGIFHSDQ